jgi:hypothetical protein
MLSVTVSTSGSGSGSQTALLDSKLLQPGDSQNGARMATVVLKALTVREEHLP